MKHSKLAEEIAEILFTTKFYSKEAWMKYASALIDQKLSGVRGGLGEIIAISMGQGFGDKILNERLKRIDTKAYQLWETLKVEGDTGKE